VSAALVALAQPIMRVVAFGGIEGTGVTLLAAALASLALGLYVYSAFLLLARAYYALGDSRTPAIVAIVAAVVGVLTMVVLAPMTHGAARVASLGIGHTVAYMVGTVVLGIGVSRRIGRGVFPVKAPRALLVSVVLAIGAWLVVEAVDPTGRFTTLALLVVIGVVGTGLYVLAMQLLRDPVRLPHEGSDASEMVQT
jgi:putative peptidoglycan lipid II flippase